MESKSKIRNGFAITISFHFHFHQAAVALLEAEGLSPKFHLFDLANKQTVFALRDFMLQRYQVFKIFGTLFRYDVKVCWD